MTIQQFAERFQIHIRRDECGDLIIPGSRGHLYIDAGAVCFMALDSKLSKARVTPLGGTQWIGQKYYDEKRRSHRDVWACGIPEEKWKLAIKLAGIRRIRALSPERREKAVAALARFRADPAPDRHGGARTHRKG
jgi:hypothetical protein